MSPGRADAIRRVAALAVAFALTAAGCDTEHPVSSTPDEPSPTHRTVSTPAPLAAPDPCDLVKPAKIRWLRRLGAQSPTKESGAKTRKCVWEIDEGQLVISRLETTITDYSGSRFNPDSITSDLIDGCTGTRKTSPRGDLCLSRSRQGMQVGKRNIYVTAIWSDRAVNRTKPEASRRRKEDEINQELSDQILTAISR
ncbi:hypothetical protein amrb99_34650 [Actinomadura sp. RB99]|uniref:hypothetical protein n=1 Tax=Actinomadura sp. RB99 TaxID=2691577 RepID=UPI0016898C47|nr:hypothetical protein [Actinomadura sp. RB99]MBD2894539.1 hypothetical protein [Actinomadura sp. RB99]